jgi:pimeloyl-ACP methyl ester carboxylesterase
VPYVQTSDLKVHYLQQGRGEPVLFLHGFPETSHQWRHQLAAVAEAGYAGFAPDNRGFGRTDKPGARVSRSLLADDVIRFLDAIGIERCALVGHDWGGIIASKVALDHPERFSRLVLVDTLMTVWSPGAQHGYWFKAEGLAESFFAAHHRDFIEVLFGGKDAACLGGRPESPWPIPPGQRARPDWISADDLAHYVDAFADPDVWAHAISYYRYALPFHEVRADPSAPHGERFVSLSEAEVAAMWLHEGGIEQSPRYREHVFDYGPEDRHKRYPGPALWLYGAYLGQGDLRQGRTSIPSGHPFVDQFSRYLPDLRARSVSGVHFLGEENPAYVNECLLAFLQGHLPPPVQPN